METAIDLADSPSAGVFHEGVRPIQPDSTASRLADILAELTDLDGSHASDAERIDQLGLLEQLKGSAAAAQSRVTVAFEESQLAVQDARGVRAKDRGRGIGDQVALARGSNANQGARHLGFAKAVVREMPHTHALLTAGQVSEWVVTLLLRETAVLTVEDRRRVDELLCALLVDPSTGEIHAPQVLGLSPRRVEAAARALAAKLDPEAVVRRAAKAAKDRRVTTRPAPDTMVWVSAVLPVQQGVACWASLDRAARALKAQGDERSLNQIRADLFVERTTGQSSPEAVPTEICLVVSGETLAGDPEDPEADRPGRTADGTVVPAGAARDWVRDAEAAGADLWVREVRTDPQTGEVIDIGKRKRFHRGLDATFIRIRDQHCRHPRCDGQIEHGDHVVPVAEGGPTGRINGQGLCEGHNYVKEMPGWSAAVVDQRPGRHTIEVTTPTGHTYQSHAPPALPPTH